jgi:hypothetical protein
VPAPDRPKPRNHEAGAAAVLASVQLMIIMTNRRTPVGARAAHPASGTRAVLSNRLLSLGQRSRRLALDGSELVEMATSIAHASATTGSHVASHDAGDSMKNHNSTRQKRNKLALKRDIIHVLTSSKLAPIRGGSDLREPEDLPSCVNPIYSA